MQACVSWNVIDKLGKQPRTHTQVMPSHVVSHKVSHEVLYERKWITFGVVNIETTWEHMDRRPNTREREINRG